MISVQLDKLPIGEQICVSCELMRRLQQRIVLHGIKLSEQPSAIDATIV